MHPWLRWWLAIYLGTMMLGYGIGKVLQDQMLPPSLSKLFVRFGDLSPQALLWAFMGSSRTYTRFAGSVEVLGGVLLFFPRLTTIGALISLGALTNVLVLDASYDVGVMLFCFNLMLISSFLIAPEVPRLANLLIFNRPIEPVDWRLQFRRKWVKYGLVAAQLMFGAYVFVTFWNESYARQKNFNALPQTVPFYGIWTVAEFSINGQLRPLVVTDDECWYRVIFDAPDGFDVPYDNQQFPAMAIISTSGARHLYWVRFDAAINILRLMKLDDSQRVGGDWTPTFQATAQMKIEHPSPERLELDGQLEGNRIHAVLRRTEMNFILRTRGFHWIVNNPYWAR
jgi:uncharacterized membrane protein YphA (DoxX/SURF4 family)